MFFITPTGLNPLLVGSKKHPLTRFSSYVEEKLPALKFSFFVEVLLLASAFAAYGQTPPAGQVSLPPQLMAVARAQQTAPGSGGFTFSVKSRLVVLDVVVTDKAGNFVGNLTKDDFRVYDNKIFQPISFFDVQHAKPVDTKVPPVSIDSTTELDKKAPSEPVSVIVLDEINTKFQDEAFTRIALKKYLAAQEETLLQPTMLVAVNLNHLMVLRDYTTSRQAILDALNHHLQENPWKTNSGSFKADQYDAAFASLIEVAQATAGHPGHKSIIWIGKGMPTVNPASLLPDVYDSLQTMISFCTNILRDARITLYTVDPAGVPIEEPDQDTDGFYDSDPFGGQVDFNQMAMATGGQAFWGRNDIDVGVGSSILDGSRFYTLSYVPSDTDDDPKKFHNIQIRMVNPDLTARTRFGYYSGNPPIAPAVNTDGKLSDRFLFDMMVAADSIMVYDAVPFTVQRDPSQPDGFDISIDARHVDWDAVASGPPTTHIALLAESFDKHGKMLQREAKIVSAQAPAQSAGGSAQSAGLKLHISIPTKSPAARLRLVVRMNSTGKLGADNFFLVDRKTLNDPSVGLRP